MSNLAPIDSDNPLLTPAFTMSRDFVEPGNRNIDVTKLPQGEMYGHRNAVDLTTFVGDDDEDFSITDTDTDDDGEDFSITDTDDDEEFEVSEHKETQETNKSKATENLERTVAIAATVYTVALVAMIPLALAAPVCPFVAIPMVALGLVALGALVVANVKLAQLLGQAAEARQLNALMEKHVKDSDSYEAAITSMETKNECKYDDLSQKIDNRGTARLKALDKAYKQLEDKGDPINLTQIPSCWKKQKKEDYKLDEIRKWKIKDLDELEDDHGNKIFDGVEETDKKDYLTYWQNYYELKLGNQNGYFFT